MRQLSFVKTPADLRAYAFRGIPFSKLLTSNKSKCYKLWHITCFEPCNTSLSTGTPTQETENSQMNEMILKMYVNLKTAMASEEGQDLVEYALVVALIAFGAVTGMGYLATGINHAFSDIATILNADV